MPGDRTDALLRGYQLASLGVSIALGMALPSVVGLGLDHLFGTRPWLAVCGVVVGFVLGIARLVALGNERQSAQATQSGRPGERNE